MNSFAQLFQQIALLSEEKLNKLHLFLRWLKIILFQFIYITHIHNYSTSQLVVIIHKYCTCSENLPNTRSYPRVVYCMCSFVIMNWLFNFFLLTLKNKWIVSFFLKTINVLVIFVFVFWIIIRKLMRLKMFVSMSINLYLYSFIF